MGPAITLGWVVLGAGAGMYGCLNPPESETVGAFRADDGVRMPFDSPMNCGLSSQLAADDFGVLETACFSGALSGTISGGIGILSEPLSPITIAGLIMEGLGCSFASIRGGGIPVS